jgi:hypothetical protein
MNWRWKRETDASETSLIQLTYSVFTLVRHTLFIRQKTTRCWNKKQSQSVLQTADWKAKEEPALIDREASEFNKLSVQQISRIDHA